MNYAPDLLPDEWGVPVEDAVELEKDLFLSQEKVKELKGALRELLDRTEWYWDEGPAGEGWPSDKLTLARNTAEDLLKH